MEIVAVLLYVLPALVGGLFVWAVWVVAENLHRKPRRSFYKRPVRRATDQDLENIQRYDPENHQWVSVGGRIGPTDTT